MADTSPRTIPQLIDEAAVRFPLIDGLVDTNTRWSYPELRERIHVATRALMASGVESGDRVAIWAPNVSEWVVAALGIHAAGAVLVPVNSRFRGREAAYVLERSRARMLFTVTDFLDTDYVQLLDEVGEVSTLEETVVLRGRTHDDTTSWTDFLARADAVDEVARAARSAAVTGDDLCHILFTSGTTGAPKGAMLTHASICRAYRVFSDVIGVREGDRYMIVLPFFHSFGLNAGILTCLMTGSTMVPHLVFDATSVMQRVVEERITVLPGPPSVYQQILNHPDRASYDLSSLRVATLGAAAIPVELVDRMRDEMRIETVVTGYGITEASGIVTMCRYDDDPEVIATTAGRPLPALEVRLVDDDGTDVPHGRPGELLVRGYNLMRGYVDDPQETAATIDADGWLHTGDLAVMHDDGTITITDRKKDMFIVGGFNAYPAEIESMMAAHPAIGQVAIIGVPDERLGEVGHAYVIPRPGATCDPAAIIAWCREQMANYKVPRSIELVDSLPLNASGKVLKYELRQRAAALPSARSGDRP